MVYILFCVRKVCSEKAKKCLKMHENAPLKCPETLENREKQQEKEETAHAKAPFQGYFMLY